MSETLTVLQLSDLHLSLPGNRSHGGFGYDTDLAYEQVFAQCFGDPARHPDLAVITGDIVDHGTAAEYAIAATALKRLPVPANLLPGNHDYDIPLRAALPRPDLTMDRVQRIGPWLFVFADSNAEFRVEDEHGRLVDTEQRIETSGLLGAREVAWIDDVIAASDAEHVWLWMHHPPAMTGPFHAPAFNAEITGLVDRHPRIRGIGAGHVHTDLITEIAGCEVHLCPALTINFDITNWKTLAPGYRRYEFGADGSVKSASEFLDYSDDWPEFDLPQPVIDHFAGKLSWDEMQAEVAKIIAAFADG